MKKVKKVWERAGLLRRLCALTLSVSMLAVLQVPAFAETEAESETVYKLEYTLNQTTFDGEDYYDMKNTATDEDYVVSCDSSKAITDYNYEAGFKIKLSNPGTDSILQIKLMGNNTDVNLLGNVKFVSYKSHEYAYRLLCGNTELADKDNGLITDGETWNDIRFVIRETPSDGDTSTTDDDIVSYDVYVNGNLVKTQTGVGATGLNGTNAATRNPYQFIFNHYTNAGNSILIDDVWIAKYVPYEPLTTQKLVYTMDNKSFSGADNYDLNNTAAGEKYELDAGSKNAITDYNYEAGFKIKLSNPGAASSFQTQLMGSGSNNIINNVKFEAQASDGYAYYLKRGNNTVLADKDDGLITDGETWNDIRFVIRETPSDGDASTTDDDKVSYDVYINGILVSTQTNISVNGLNGANESSSNPYKWKFKHDTNGGNSILIDDVWIARYEPSGIGWEFDDAVELKSYWKSSSANYSVADSVLTYTAPAKYEEAALTYTPAEAIDNSVYAGLKVKMKHSYSDSTVTSGAMKLYLSGTATVDGTETAFDYTTGAVTAVLGEASSDFTVYEFPLDELLGEVDLSTASISSLKLVPMDSLGSYEIDSIWIVDNLNAPLDASKMSLAYSFDDNAVGSAMGVITLGFGGQRSTSANTVELYWADGNAQDGYTPLADNTRIVSITGAEAEEGYSITKNMIIPETAKALIARVTDMEKTFDIVYEIPAEKLLEEKEPGFVLALTSDFHFGDPTYQTHAPSEKMLKARDIIDSTADAIIVSGDIIDTFGGRSWYTVRGMNGLGSYGYRIDPAEEESDEVTLVYYETAIDENGKKILTDTPTGRVETVKNTDCYDMAYDYFTGFDTPVYLVEGNHESPEAAYLDYVGVSPQRTKRLLTRFIDWSVANGKYTGPMERNMEVYDNRYEESINYDAYVTDSEGNEYHCIFLRNFGSDRPVKFLTEEELDWLDKKLYENESTGKPIFLVSHIMPVRYKVGKMESYGYYGLNFPEFEAVINKHPSVVVISGHTHQSQDQDNQSYYDGAEEEPSFINVPAMKHSWVSGSELSADYAMLVYAEMYDDKIITRGYETATEKNVSRGTGQITRKAIPTAMGSLSVTRTENTDGTYTLTASCADANATYEWILADKTQAGNSVTLAADYEGYIAVRATDADGNYISDSFNGLHDNELIGTEERHYFAVAGQENGLNPLTDASGDAAVWANGVGGKNTVDEAAQLTASDATSAYYQLKNAWTKQEDSSKYLIATFDAMPMNDDSTGIFVASGDTRLSADVSEALATNKWNNITVVCNMADGEVETYVNGVLQGTTSAALTEGSYLKFGIESSATAELEGYIDNLAVYETATEPLLAKRIEKSFDELTDTTLYSAEKKTLYLPTGTVCSALAEQMGCVVVAADGSSKSGDSAVADGDCAVYHDANSRQYVYYDIVLYSDYDRLVLGGNVEDDDVVLYVNAKSAGDTVVIAYYDSNDRFVGCEITAETSVGLNKIPLNVSGNAHSAKVMVWKSTNGITPLAEAVPVE